MLTLDVSVDLGPGATPMQLETLVKAVRVATDVGRSAELRRVRRTATEQMKFPTDAELRDALERFPTSETGPGYRARRQLEARDRLAEEAEDLPLEFWYRYRRRRSSEAYSYLSGTGFERAFAGTSVPWSVGASLGLDVADPILYQALVADQVVREAPGEIIVREVRYSNPFGEVVAGVGAAQKAVKTTAGVIETAATLGSRRKLKKVEAQVAEATIDDQIDDVRIDVDLKREQLRRARIENDIADEELRAKQIQNAQALHCLNAQRRQQALVEHFVAVGELDQADAIAAADPADATALIEFALRLPRLEESYAADPDEVE